MRMKNSKLHYTSDSSSPSTRNLQRLAGEFFENYFSACLAWQDALSYNQLTKKDLKRTIRIIQGKFTWSGAGALRVEERIGTMIGWTLRTEHLPHFSHFSNSEVWFYLWRILTHNSIPEVEVAIRIITRMIFEFQWTSDRLIPHCE